MATNLKARRQKLYFDITFAGTQTNATRCCTQFTNGTPGDRYGNLLTAVEALTGSAASAAKVRSAVSAWFVVNQDLAFSPTPTSGALTQIFQVDFIQPTSNGTQAAALRLPYLTVGTLTPIATLAGHEAIYSITNTGALRHFGCRVKRKFGGAGATVSGTLYVQRQHSIEV